MPLQITEKTFFQYIKCPYWVYFDIHGNNKRFHEPLMQLLHDSGLIKEYHKNYLEKKEDIVQITSEDQEEAYLQTLEFMKSGRQTIYNGTLLDNYFVGHPDILEKVEGKSKLGNYYYVAADIKYSRNLHEEFKFQGCFYAELLEKIQGTKPLQGYIITPDNDLLSYLIEEFEVQYRLTLHSIEEIIAGKKPAHFLTAGCKQSPWFEECLEISNSCKDLSLLNRIWKEEVAHLKKSGVETIDQLANLSDKDLTKIFSDSSFDRISFLQLQAKSLVFNKHIVKEKIELEKNQIELYFDIESNPLRDQHYLFGVLVVEGEKSVYHSFFASSKEEESKIWSDFVGCVESYFDAPIYHYGNYEQAVVTRLANKYGISKIANEAIERNMIDLLEIIRPAIIFPIYFYSLKDIATYIGFSWRSKDASGANSVVWYENWLKDQNNKELKKKIIEYNEDDVIATYKVKKWIEKQLS